MLEKRHVSKGLPASFFVKGSITLLLFMCQNFMQIDDHLHVVFPKINILGLGLRCSFFLKISLTQSKIIFAKRVKEGATVGCLR